MTSLLDTIRTSAKATQIKKNKPAPELPSWFNDVPQGQANPFTAPVSPTAGLVQSVVAGNSTEEILKRMRARQGLLAAAGGGETGGYQGLMNVLGLR